MLYSETLSQPHLPKKKSDGVGEREHHCRSAGDKDEGGRDGGGKRGNMTVGMQGRERESIPVVHRKGQTQEGLSL